MKKKHPVFKVTAALIIMCTVYGCSSNPHNDPFSGIDPYGSGLGNRVESYHKAVFTPIDSNQGNIPALYIDFSAGMHTAFSNPEIKTLLGDCFNAVLADKFEVYQMVSGAVTPLEITNSTELGQKVNDPKEYLNTRAPIQMAVEKIVASNNEALLITDFEEFQNNQEITNTAYLKIPFSKWLAKGNAVNFYVANYSEGKVIKHIYFTLFSRGTGNPQNLLSKLESKLAMLNTKFVLSTQTYKLSTDYPTEKWGGIFTDPNGKSEAAKNIMDLKNGYINGLKKDEHFEFYPLGVDWATIDQLHTDYVQQNQFGDFFRKLFIDLGNEDSYLYGDFDVRVYDVSADFVQFFKCQEVKKHKPKLTKGNNGEAKFADDESDPIAKECYNMDGSLKAEWVFKPQEVVVQNEVFTLNQTLFKNTRGTDKKKTEFGVSFDQNFKGGNIQNPEGLLRVDIVIKTAQPNLSNPTLDYFKWTNANGVSNTALRESIVNTLQELKPENKVVYSYYIKTNQ